MTTTTTEIFEGLEFAADFLKALDEADADQILLGEEIAASLATELSL